MESKESYPSQDSRGRIPNPESLTSNRISESASHRMPNNIKNAEGTNTDSSYYADDKHLSDATNDDVNGHKKLIADFSWRILSEHAKRSEDVRNAPEISENSFSRHAKQLGSNEVLYNVTSPVPGGFPIITLHSGGNSEDVTDGTGRDPQIVAKDPELVRHAWSNPRTLLKFSVFSQPKRTRPPVLPKSILKEIELSDRAEADDTFGLMRDGEGLLMVRHARWVTRTVNAFCWLEDDFIRVSYRRSRCWLPNMNTSSVTGSFDIRDVILERRVTQGNLPETHCFSVVFSGKRKTLNFMAGSEESAKSWFRGLNYIKKKLSTLPPRLTQQLFLWEIFRKADRDKDGTLTYPEVHELFRRKGRLATREDRSEILHKFMARTTKENPRVDFELFIEFYQTATLLPEFQNIFKKYSADKRILTAREIYKFLQESQGEYDVTETDCLRIIEDYEMSDVIRERKQMSVHGFVSFMLSKNCEVFNKRHDEVYQDMKHPLSHYFIASSHNTYLMADQLRGPSSTDAYMKALLQGCRCVELDCWDGRDGEPIIFHGHTFTSKIKFKDAIQVIGKYAFEASRFPLILSIENHCSVKQQEKMAAYMQRILGAELLTEPILPDSEEERLPSPAALQGKILLKGKKLPVLSSDDEDGDVSDEDEAAEMDVDLSKNLGLRLFRWKGRDAIMVGKAEEASQENSQTSDQSLRTKKQEKKLKLSKDLSDQVVYCKSTKFKGFDEAMRSTTYREISSFSENKAYRLATQDRAKAIQFHATNLNRTYPGATRTDSSNYDPQPLWNAGFQVVALNYQTKCDEMTLYHGKFRQNGRCGYLLKPEFMRVSRDSYAKTCPIKLQITVICGSDIAVDVDEESSLSVEVEIVGEPTDQMKLRTKSVNGSGYNPVWDDELTFQVSTASLAMVWFKVFNDSLNVGQFVLPFESVAQGYRTVHLLDSDGIPLKHSHLLVHITVMEQSLPSSSHRSESSQSSSSSSGRRSSVES